MTFVSHAMIKNRSNFCIALFCLILFLQIISFLVGKFWFYTLNDQVFFGSMGSNSIALYIIFALVFLVCVFMAVKNLYGWPFLFLLAGSSSNILDRLVHGGVIDYFGVPRLFTFNLSDLYITIGLGGILYLLIMANKKHPLDLF